MKAFVIALSLSVAPHLLLAADPPPAPPLSRPVIKPTLPAEGGPAVTNRNARSSTSETAQGKVEKIYTVTEDNLKFIAYVVKWKDAEVIVNDPVSRTDYKVGDTISFSVRKMSMEGMGGGVHSINFSVVPNNPRPGVPPGVGVPGAPAPVPGQPPVPPVRTPSAPAPAPVQK